MLTLCWVGLVNNMLTLCWIGLIVGLCLAVAGFVFRTALKIVGFVLLLILGLVLAVPCGFLLLGWILLF